MGVSVKSPKKTLSLYQNNVPGLDFTIKTESKTILRNDVINLKTDFSNKKFISTELDKLEISNKINSITQNKEFKKLITDYMHNSLRKLKIQRVNKIETIFKDIYELQILQCEVGSIWVVKPCFSGEYLAVGGKSGVLTIYSISALEDSLPHLDDNQFPRFLNFIEEIPLLMLSAHSSDIIDLCWFANVNILFKLVGLSTRLGF